MTKEKSALMNPLRSKAVEQSTLSSPLRMAGRQAGTSVCPRCGASFACGMQSGQEPCWCAALPPVMPLDLNTESTSTCYCSECLKELIGKRIAK